MVKRFISVLVSFCLCFSVATAAFVPDEGPIVQAIRTIAYELEEMIDWDEFYSSEKKVINPLMDLLCVLLDDAKCGIKISERYVDSEYSWEKERYLFEYNKLSKAQQGVLRTKLGNNLDPDASDLLSVMFLDAPITPSVPLYAIRYATCINGEIWVAENPAEPGAAVTVFAEPDDKYELSYISVNGEVISGNTFTMPEETAVVYAVFVRSDCYPITVSKTANGNVTTDKDLADYGDVVSLTAFPNKGYKLKHFVVDGSAIVGNTFVMPNKDVTVSAEFEPIDYNITSEITGKGTVTVVPTAHCGDTVTITATPNNGFELVSVKVDGVAINGNVFTMPAKDVIVSAEFKPVDYRVYLSTVNGAQIRTVGNQGLRFISSIQKSEDFEHVTEYGILLIPSDDITDISQLQIGATLNGHTVAKVPAKAIYDETDSTVTFTAVITNIAVKNYTRAYTARAYAMFDNGTVVYADSGASRSIYQVAERGLQDPYASEENKAVFQAIVDAVSNDDIWGGIY